MKIVKNKSIYILRVIKKRIANWQFIDGNAEEKIANRRFTVGIAEEKIKNCCSLVGNVGLKNANLANIHIL